MSQAASLPARSITFLTDDSVHIRGSYWEGRGDAALTTLLVHDAGSNRTCWDPYVPLFRTRGWNVLSFDLRGHGESVRQDMRHTLLRPEEGNLTSPHAYPADVRAAVAFAQRQTKHQPGRLALIGLGLGADLGYAGSARGWGAVTNVLVSLDEARARALGGAGSFAPRSCYLIYGDVDPEAKGSAEAFEQTAVPPSEAFGYPTNAHGLALWAQRQPETIARAIGWIEKTL